MLSVFMLELYLSMTMNTIGLIDHAFFKEIYEWLSVFSFNRQCYAFDCFLEYMHVFSLGNLHGQCAPS